ncbi:hypothetical protein AVEN_46140-1 [Araneus ventricosus]|uniref:Mariner Mos1 transposase n=1 Tax=Araneus ventricosus TaxID=182803 RepID=A0A4Y2D7E2_ARAVE|nr:hypothetical protein AVEN_46140-1 [Araneus ventricosus]
MNTGDEKLSSTIMFSENSLGVIRVCHQHPPKTNIPFRKVMLCYWWDWKDIVYYELLPSNQTIYSVKYQLDNFEQNIYQKFPELANHKGMAFHQDNSRQHVFWLLGRSLWSLTRISYHTLPIVLTLHLRNAIPSAHCKNSLK